MKQTLLFLSIMMTISSVVFAGFDWGSDCNSGQGQFEHEIPRLDTVVIGEIPANKSNVVIDLTSSEDLDIQLYAGDKALAQWPDGDLNGPGKQTLEYSNMEIEWSGYEGTNGNFGHEHIKIRGTITEELTIKAFAYDAGKAQVTYEWGIGTGEHCGTRGTGRTGGDLSVDKPGECHGEIGYESNLPAAEDEACATDADCEEGLLCSNFNINDPLVGTEYSAPALCKPHWMLGEFTNSEVLTIDAGSFADADIDVQGLATVAIGAFVTIEMDMGYNGASEDDLTFEIIPHNTGYDTNFRTSIVDPAKISRVDSFVTITDLPVSFPGDDAVNGTWTLRITNANTNGKSARLQSFGLKVSSHWD